MKWKVPYSYLDRQFAHPKKILNSIEKFVVGNGDFTLGKRVEVFEKKFAELAGTRYSIGVSSGTAALYLSLHALGISDGEVITTPNTFCATVNAIVAAGARPVFVDVGEDYNINPDLIEDAINDDTKAIMPVHLTGRPANMHRIMNIAKKYNLYVIEDAAQAIGAKIDGVHVGNFGSLAGFSFHPLKNLHVWGDGGMIVTNNEDHYQLLKELRNQGLRNRDTWQNYGHNLRLATIQAEIGNCLIGDTKSQTEKRISNAYFYDEKLASILQITLPLRKTNIREVFHTYVIQSNTRDALHKYLLQRGIETKIHYPIPLHLQPAAKNLGYVKGDFPVAERQAERILSLPVHPYLTKEERTYVVDTVKDFYKQ